MSESEKIKEIRRSFWLKVTYEWRHVVTETKKYLLKEADNQRLKFNEELLDRTLHKFIDDLAPLIALAEHRKRLENYGESEKLNRLKDEEFIEEWKKYHE